MKIKKNLDLKTFFLCLVLSIVWILYSDFLVHQGLYNYFDLHFVQTLKGLIYVTFLSFLLAYFHQREKNALKNKQVDYTRLFFESPQILAIYELNTYQILDANQRAVEHYGYSRNELLSMTIFDLRSDKEKIKLKSVLDSEGVRAADDMVWIHKKKGGEQFPVKIFGYEICFKSMPCRIVTVTDVTELRAAEELTLINSKLITLGEVSANIGHEIQNPLSIMDLTLGKLEKQLQKQGMYEENINELELLNSSILRVSDTVSSLQRLSRGEIESDRDEVLISLFVKESTILIRQQLDLYAVSLEFGYLPEVKMYCHSGQLTQVFLNIIKNALDALIEADVQYKLIKIYANLDNVAEKVQIYIQNNGPLLEEDVIDELYTPFFTTKEKGQGSGLGLPLSQKIVVAHGGKLKYEVIDGLVHFMIELPLGKKAL
jgi:two-component system sensor kinase FixL